MRNLYLTLIILFSFSPHSFSQLTCFAANAGSDASICVGNGVTIGSAGNPAWEYWWSPATGLNNPNIAQPYANPTTSTTYTLTVSTDNLLSNGSFEMGDTSFTSQYPLAPSSLHPNGHGSYGITYSPSAIRNGWCIMADHSANGDYMMVVDGNENSSSNPFVWSETVNVTTNTDYEFSGFVFTLVHPHPAIEVRINNTVVLANFEPTNYHCDNVWSRFSIPTWNSGASTTAVIEIRTTSIQQLGNDFALDDLRFSETCPNRTDQVTVLVSNNAPGVSPSGPITYYNQYETPQQVRLRSTIGATYQWYKDGVAIPGANSRDYWVQLDGAGSSTNYYRCDNACGSSNTVTVNYHGYSSITASSYFPNSFFGSLPSGPFCSSVVIPGYQLPAAYIAPGQLETWWLYNPGSCFAINSSTGMLSQPGFNGTWCTDGVYTKASKNGEEVYVYYIIGSDPGCRMMMGSNPNSNQQPSNSTNQKTTLCPNPATSEIVVTAPGGVDMVEIYNETGILMRRQNNKGSNRLVVSTATLPNGIYVCRITGKNRQETIRFMVMRQ